MYKVRRQSRPATVYRYRLDPTSKTSRMRTNHQAILTLPPAKPGSEITRAKECAAKKGSQLEFVRSGWHMHTAKNDAILLHYPEALQSPASTLVVIFGSCGLSRPVLVPLCPVSPCSRARPSEAEKLRKTHRLRPG